MENKNEWGELIDDPETYLDASNRTTGTVVLVDDDNLEKEKQGATNVHIRFNRANMEITNDCPQNQSYGEQLVYWLPYDKNKVSHVSTKDLQSSKCLVFVTTTFSGCRFSMTDDYVAHVPSGRMELLQKHYQKAKSSSTVIGDNLDQVNALARDEDEQKLSDPESRARHKFVRRTLTPTKLSEMDANQKEVYKATEDHLNDSENAVVIGVRKNAQQPFHFYAQITKNGQFVRLADLGTTPHFELATEKSPAIETKHTPTLTTNKIVNALGGNLAENKEQQDNKRKNLTATNEKSDSGERPLKIVKKTNAPEKESKDEVKKEDDKNPDDDNYDPFIPTQ